MLIEVFKTNITDKQTADEIVAQFSSQFPDSRINFDLADCDNILRVESNNDVTKLITEKLAVLGYYCEPLE